MSTALRERLGDFLERQSPAVLAVDELKQVVAALDAQRDSGSRPSPRQELLYIQAENTHPGASAIGMLLVREGQCEEPPVDYDRWPYHSALEAMNDGWRVIAVPNAAQLADPAVPSGLGCEFVLERWR